jgi:murein peptide amidase A
MTMRRGLGTGRRTANTLAAAVVAASIGLAVTVSSSLAVHVAPTGISRAAHRSVQALHVIGYSVERRPIVAILRASARAGRSMLVVGSIAGDEPGGTTITKALASLPAVRGVRLWLIPDMNPDGAARATRVNADGVDLNRNFPFRWRPLSDTDSRYYPGPRPASEPESQAVAAFISRMRPGLTIWLHQPYGLIDDSQGPPWAEQLLSRTTALPLERLNDYPGSAIGWEDHLIPRSAFDLELPGLPLTPSLVRRYVDAIRLLARTYAKRPLRR